MQKNCHNQMIQKFQNLLEAVWPYVEIKSSLKFSKVAQKVPWYNSFYLKVTKYLGKVCREILSPRTFKNRWIWSQCSFSNGPIFGLIFFIFVFSKHLTVYNVQYKFCWWLDSNRGPLLSEATALPTEPKELPIWSPCLEVAFDYIRFPRNDSRFKSCKT